MARTPSRIATPRRRYAKRLAPTQRRDQLLDAALSLIVESGFPAVSIAAVAERGDVTRPVVYDLFASREEVVAELIERESRRMHEAVERSLSAADPESAAAERFSAILARFLTEVRAMPDTWRLVYFPIDGVPPALRDRVEKARADLRGPYRRGIGEWLAEHPDQARGVDIEVLVRVLQGLVQTGARLVLDDPERYSPERVVALLDPLFVAEP